MKNFKLLLFTLVLLYPLKAISQESYYYTTQSGSPDRTDYMN